MNRDKTINLFLCMRKTMGSVLAAWGTGKAIGSALSRFTYSAAVMLLVAPPLAIAGDLAVTVDDNLAHVVSETSSLLAATAWVSPAA